jgi:hypothetical protein
MARKMGKKNKALPILTAALLCEKVLVDQDGALTPVRIVDVITLPSGTVIEAGSILKLDLTLLFLFKSGEARGDRQFRLFLVKPSGNREEAGTWTSTFAAPPEGGANIRMGLALKWEREGLYWFEVFLEDTELARIPVRVRIAQSDHAAKNEGK